MFSAQELNKITEVDPEPMTMAEELVPLTQWHEVPVQDRFDQMILTNTGCTRGCVQNSICGTRMDNPSFYGCHLEWGTQEALLSED